MAAFATGRHSARILALAVIYAGLGLLAVRLAVPPGFAAPIYPSAGIALAAVLVYGRTMAVGVFLGAFAVNAILELRTGATLATVPWMGLLAGMGAALQALLGTALVRRFIPGPLRLSEPREVLLFFVLGGAVACLLSATVGNGALLALGLIAPRDLPFNWWSWWSGDTLGVLIATPITLTLVGQPRDDWAARRTNVALPLVAATLLLAAATLLLSRWENHRLRSVFERDASAATEAMDDRLQSALFALEAAHGLYAVQGPIDAEALRRASAPWFRLNLQIQAIGYAQRVAPDDLQHFEDTVRAQPGQTAYRVFNRGVAGPPAPVPGTQALLPIRDVEPRAGNSAALGVNILSVPMARRAAEAAVMSDVPVATQGFKVTQETADQTGVVVYRALYHGDPSAAQRAAAWYGVVFVTLRMQQAAEAAMADSARYLRWCLVDLDPLTDRPHLAGPSGCHLAAPQPLELQRSVNFAGRHWRMTVGASRADIPDGGQSSTWLFSSVGLVSAAMLAALLLTVTGRTRRIEAAVTARTADLQREVAERQRTESALRQSEQRFRNIFDQAPLGIAYTDLAGRIDESNPRLRALLGLEGDALAQRALTELAPPEDRAAESDALVALLRSGQGTAARRLRLQHRDGAWLWVQMSWSVLRDAQGRPQRLVAVVEDITDQLKREEAEQGRQVAESANRAKNEFLSRMSHELRTPLNAMLGFAQLLELDRQPRLAPHQAGWTGHILQAGWHLLEMINDILDLSRIEAGMLRLEPAPVALRPLVDQCLAMVAHPAAARGIRLVCRIADDATVALGDETRIKQVLTNLLSNAVKYNVEGGEVLVECRRHSGDRLTMTVSDTGPGLTAAQLAKLFQPFNRLGREQGNVEGTGIGLVISRRLAEWMGGTLEADSAPGDGARFTVNLPCAEAGPAPADNAGPKDGALRQRRQRQVLYIEDNETNAEVMRGILTQRPEVVLRVAETVAEGLSLLEAATPDLVLMDMHLPDGDGLDLLRTLRATPRWKQLPVLVVSADATPDRVNDALSAGALHYLTKPLNVGAFLSLIDQVLEEIDATDGPPLAAT